MGHNKTLARCLRFDGETGQTSLHLYGLRPNVDRGVSSAQMAVRRPSRMRQNARFSSNSVAKALRQNACYHC